MRALFNRVNSFLRSIQRSDRARKKRWVVGLSASVMVVIITLWFIYLDVAIPSLTPEEKELSPGAWETFSRGLRTVGETIHNDLERVKTKVAPLWSSIERNLEQTVTYTTVPTSTASATAPDFLPLPELIEVTSTATATTP